VVVTRRSDAVRVGAGETVTPLHACAGDACRLCGADARDAGQAQAMDARPT
jgi:hypothetical protein